MKSLFLVIALLSSIHATTTIEQDIVYDECLEKGQSHEVCMNELVDLYFKEGE